MGEDDNAIEVRLTDSEREVFEVLRRINKGKAQAGDLEAYRGWLRDNPHAWRRIGDISEQAVGALEKAIAGKNTLFSEALLAGRTEMREELGYAEAPALVRLLIDNVVLCWMRFHATERWYTEFMQQGGPLAQADWWERRLSAAHGRYLRACAVLAQIRRMMRDTPTLQVNIATYGGRQVNVAGDLQTPLSGQENGM